MSEISANNYNLNIPRYVNTFEEQEQIDIADIAVQLQRLEKDMAKTDAQIAAYCRELGIPAPFKI
jgi:type I restriction enzyme M protein